MTHGQPRIMCIRRRHPIRPTVWGMPSVGKGEAPSLFWPQPSASLTPPSPGPPYEPQQQTGCMFDEPLSKLRRLSIPGSLFTWGLLEYREVGESGFPLTSRVAG